MANINVTIRGLPLGRRTTDATAHDPKNGQFTSGSGGASGSSTSKRTSNSSIPFVKTAFEEHGSLKGIATKLQSTPKETLNKAHDLLKKHVKPDDKDAHAVLKLIGKELDDRASRGS